MELFTRLYAHNIWANTRVLRAAASAPPGFLGDPGGGFDQAVESRMQQLQHMLGVERGFLDALVGPATMPGPPGDLAALGAYARGTADGFAALCAGLDERSIEEPFFVPWWEREFPRSVGLLQALSHSGQHRAEIAFDLSRAGLDTGNLDYIVWFAHGSPERDDPWPPSG